MSYYIKKKSKLLKDFDKTASLMQDFVVERYGEEFAHTLHTETMQQYDELMADVPHIKGARARALNSFLLITAQELAVYRAMKKHGKTIGETWEICHEAIRRRMEEFPALKRWLLRKLMHCGLLMKRIKVLVRKGRQLKFGDFEVKYLVGDGSEFDWGVDYVACGNYNFLKAHGGEEFAPYVCMSDIALSDALGWGLIRTHTIADGYDFCDFRFKKAGKTRISSKTPEVQAVIERIREKEDLDR